MTSRMRYTQVAVTALALYATVQAAGASAQATSDPKRSKLPAAVTKALDENCPGGLIDKLSMENEEGIRFYDIEFKAGRGEMDVAEDGTVLDVATIVTLEEVPEAAAAPIRKAAGTNGIRVLEKSEVRSRVEKQNGKARIVALTPFEYVYEAELVKGGEIEVTADGKILKGPKSKDKEAGKSK